MSRLPLGFVLAYLRKLSRLQSGSTIVNNDRMGGGGGEGGNAIWSACLMTTAMTTNMTLTTNMMTQRVQPTSQLTSCACRPGVVHVKAAAGICAGIP